MRETPALPLATAPPPPPPPPPISQEQTLLLLSILPLLFLSFTSSTFPPLTLPSSSHYVFLLILCHLTPLPSLHLFLPLHLPSLSRPSFLFPSPSYHSHSLAAGCLPRFSLFSLLTDSNLIFFSSPSLSLSLSICLDLSRPGLRKNMSFLSEKSWQRFACVWVLVCVCLCVCVCECSMVLTLPWLSFIELYWRVVALFSLS